MVPYEGYTIQPPSGQLNIANNKTKEVVNTIIEELSELFSERWFHASGRPDPLNDGLSGKMITCR